MVPLDSNQGILTIEGSCFFRFVFCRGDFFFSFPSFVGKQWEKSFIEQQSGDVFSKDIKFFYRDIDENLSIDFFFLNLFNLSSFNRNFRKNRSGMESQIGFDYR